MEEEHANLENFLEWAAELGISDSPYAFTQSESLTRRRSSLELSLCVSDFPEAGGRGLAAVRDLQKGELILRVPKSALMTTQRLMMEDQKLSVAVQKRPSLSSTQILTAALLNEVGKGKISWWNPYIMQLPRSYDTLASFGQFEAQCLQVDDAIWLAEKALGKAELEWKEATPLMSELKLKPQLLTLKAWRWASATISSRTMHIPWDVAGCLCPVGDFFNYAAPGEEPYASDGSRAQGIASSLQDSSWHTREISDDEKFDANSLRLTDGKYEEHVGAYCFYARRNYRKGISGLTAQEAFNVRAVEKATPVPYSAVVTPQNLIRYGLGGNSARVPPVPPFFGYGGEAGPGPVGVGTSEVEELRRRLAEVEGERDSLLEENAQLKENLGGGSLSFALFLCL